MLSVRNVSVTERTTEWNSANWRKANKVVRNLRRRIFKATQDGNLRKVRSLQRLLMRSYSNILVSVRRVTQTNSGKHTADTLAKFIPWRPLPARRVNIPKPNGKMRPLGIPSIIDRCLQAIVKNALEPFL